MNRTHAYRHVVAMAVFGCLLCLLANGSVMGHEWFASDDEAFVVAPVTVENPSLHDRLTTPALGHVMPATFATYRVAHAIGGLEPAPFHALSLVFAMAAAAMLGALLVLVLGSTKPAVAGAAAGTAFFAFHPATVEAVAWIAALKDVAPLVFLLGAAVLIVRGDLRRPGTLLGVAALFVLAMAFKPSSAALVIVVAWAAASRRQMNAGTGVLLAAMSALGAIAMQMTRGYQSELGLLREFASLGEQVRTVAYVFRLQLQQVLAPFDVLLGERVVPTGFRAAGDVFLLLAVLVVAAIALFDVRARKLRAFSPFRLGLVWAAAFYLPVSTVLGSSHQIVSDRYLYISLAGVAICVASAARTVFSRTTDAAASRTRMSSALAAAALCALLLAMAFTHRATLERWATSPAYFAALYERFPPIAGDAWTQSLCVQTGRSFAFRLRDYTIADIEAAIAVLETCDADVAASSVARARQLRQRLTAEQP